MNTLIVVPIALNFKPNGEVTEISEVLRRFSRPWIREVQISEGIPLDQVASSDPQVFIDKDDVVAFDGPGVLNYLARPGQVVIGITSMPLTTAKKPWEVLYGYAGTGRGVGIVSLSEPEFWSENNLVVNRAAKVAVHEFNHSFYGLHDHKDKIRRTKEGAICCMTRTHVRLVERKYPRMNYEGYLDAKSFGLCNFCEVRKNPILR